MGAARLWGQAANSILGNFRSGCCARRYPPPLGTALIRKSLKGPQARLSRGSHIGTVAVNGRGLTTDLAAGLEAA